MEKEKVKKSGSAILMDIVIDIAVVIFIVCFYFYYSGKTNSAVVLYTGVVFFTIVYQLWLRLLFGKINNKLKIRYDHPWFKEKAFERKLYDKLNVKSWKDKVPTFNPELFVMKERSLDEIATSMAKVEVDHWVNVLISLSMILFSIIWGLFPVFLIAAIAAILFDLQFIAIQRYNRPRILRVLARRNRTKTTV